MAEKGYAMSQSKVSFPSSHTRRITTVQPFTFDRSVT